MYRTSVFNVDSEVNGQCNIGNVNIWVKTFFGKLKYSSLSVALLLDCPLFRRLSYLKKSDWDMGAYPYVGLRLWGTVLKLLNLNNETI